MRHKLQLWFGLASHHDRNAWLATLSRCGEPMKTRWLFAIGMLLIVMFNNGHMYLQGQARGPHLDELILILQSLRVLNGKAVE